MKSSSVWAMAQFFVALFVVMATFARMDILLWQRIFVAHEMLDVATDPYHWGWMQALIGFTALGTLLYFRRGHRMITFPLSLTLLAFSGLEDVLYYWLDGCPIPAQLPWLAANPIILHPVTNITLLASAGWWLLVVVAVEFAGEYLHYRGAIHQALPRPKAPMANPARLGPAPVAHSPNP